MYACMHVCMGVRVYVCVCLCMCVCVHVCISVCACSSMHVGMQWQDMQRNGIKGNGCNVDTDNVYKCAFAQVSK